MLLIGITTFHQRQQLEPQLVSQQKVFLGEYAALLAAKQQSTEADPNSLLNLSLLAHIKGLEKACVYQGGLLANTLYKSVQTACPDDLNQAIQDRPAGIRAFQSFDRAGHPPGVIVLYASLNHGYTLYHDIAVVLLLLVLAGTIWLTAQGHFRKVQASFGMAEVEKLESECKEIVHHKNYKSRVPTDLPGPFKVVGAAINAMLDELQQNELQLQENAIQIQEKIDELEAQKRLHIDRNRNLQKMFVGASHDLRQPLQAMAIFIAAIREQADERQLPLILKLEHVLDNLDRLFTDLLDLSKVESRMQRIPKRSIEIAPLLRKTLEEFEVLANEKRIELRLHENNFLVYSNPNMLERIIRNMISNAIRYTRSGGVLIGSRKREGEVWIEVWDTGRGIPPDKLTEIFNEFVQIEDQDQGTNKGVGLGLFIVRKLAQLLDHSIVVKSKLRKGTLFRVVVPSALPAPPEWSIHPPRPIDTALTPQAQTFSVMLVDDDNEVRQALHALMQSWQWRVEAFDSFQTALEYAARHARELDVIITDFQLDEVTTGLNLIDQIRTQANLPIPAIIITGTDDASLIQTIEDRGIPYLRKPVKPAKLRALINVLTQATADSDAADPDNT